MGTGRLFQSTSNQISYQPDKKKTFRKIRIGIPRWACILWIATGNAGVSWRRYRTERVPHHGNPHKYNPHPRAYTNPTNTSKRHPEVPRHRPPRGPSPSANPHSLVQPSTVAVARYSTMRPASRTSHHKAAARRGRPPLTCPAQELRPLQLLGSASAGVGRAEIGCSRAATRCDQQWRSSPPQQLAAAEAEKTPALNSRPRLRAPHPKHRRLAPPRCCKGGRRPHKGAVGTHPGGRSGPRRHGEVAGWPLAAALDGVTRRRVWWRWW